MRFQSAKTNQFNSCPGYTAYIINADLFVNKLFWLEELEIFVVLCVLSTILKMTV